MCKVRKTINDVTLLTLAVVTLLCLFEINVWAGGLSWGPLPEDPPAVTCEPEESPLIVAGPMRSPVRMVEYDQDSFLLSDRSGSIYKVNKAATDNPQLLFEVTGNPMGIAYDGRYVLVGNETEERIQGYRVKEDRRGVYVRRTIRIPRSRSAQIKPLDIAVDTQVQKVFVLDGGDGDVKVYDWRQRLVQSIGSFGQLTNPQALALDPGNNRVFVTDYGDQSIGISASIQVFDYQGQHQDTISGGFSRPQGVWVEAQSIYIVDAMLGQIIELDRDTGQQLSTEGCFGSSEGHLMLPMDVIYDSGMDKFFVADNRNGRITMLPAVEQ